MASTVRNGGQTATTSLVDLYACPAATDERVFVRAANKTGGGVAGRLVLVNPSGTVVADLMPTSPIAANEAIDVFPGGWIMGAGWKFQISGPATSIDFAYSAVPAV